MEEEVEEGRHLQMEVVAAGEVAWRRGQVEGAVDALCWEVVVEALPYLAGMEAAEGERLWVPLKVEEVVGLLAPAMGVGEVGAQKYEEGVGEADRPGREEGEVLKKINMKTNYLIHRLFMH